MAGERDELVRGEAGLCAIGVGCGEMWGRGAQTRGRRWAAERMVGGVPARRRPVKGGKGEADTLWGGGGRGNTAMESALAEDGRRRGLVQAQGGGVGGSGGSRDTDDGQSARCGSVWIEIEIGMNTKRIRGSRRTTASRQAALDRHR